MAAAISYVLLLSFSTAFISGASGQCNGNFVLVENVTYADVNLTASFNACFKVFHRLKCMHMCLTQPSCQSIYYDETSGSCYLNAELFSVSSSNSVTGLSYAGYKSTQNNRSQCIQTSECSVTSGNSNPVVYSGCIDAKNKGTSLSGVYYVDPDGAGAFLVWCDFVDSSAYAVLQRRVNGSVYFWRDWADYQNGFGDVNGEYWLGLDNIHRLTNILQPQLNIYLEDFDGNFRNAYYASMYITNVTGLYKLTLGAYSGNAGESMMFRSNEMKFSTIDKDNDIWPGNCALSFKGAWWYGECTYANLNGLYLNGTYANNSYGYGITWYSWTGKYYSLKTTIMRVAV